MASPVELLTTQAQCDEVLADLRQDETDFNLRLANSANRGGKASSRASSVSREITTLDRDIADLNRELAAMAPDSKRRPEAEADMRAYVKRRGDLVASQQTTRNPTSAFRLAVMARQIAVQLLEIQQAITEVTAHRATLTA